MRKNMTVRVSKKNIKYGRVSCENSCAIALALKEKGFNQAQVGGNISVMKDGVIGVYNISPEALSFIENFDNDKASVGPTTLKLKLAKRVALKDGYYDYEAEMWW